MRASAFAFRSLLAFAAASPAAQAANLQILGQTGEGLIDRDTQLAWVYSGSNGNAANEGYRIATLDETLTLFQHRRDYIQSTLGIPPTVAADGLSYSASLGGGWSPLPPSLASVFGFNLYSCNYNDFCPPAPGNISYSATAAFVEGADGSAIPVMIQASRSSSQYGIGLSEQGVVDPQRRIFAGTAAYLPSNFYDAGGTFKASGNLMVKSVPEPGSYALVGLGLAAAAAVARKRRTA